MTEETLLVPYVITASPCLKVLMYAESHMRNSAYVYGITLCHYIVAKESKPPKED